MTSELATALKSSTSNHLLSFSRMFTDGNRLGLD
jgi:hypothetical protein